MQIIIPMSGFGERFRRAGYQLPKPLIEIDGKPIIAHVIDMFPGENDFIFSCNEEHLREPAYHMRDILKHYCPTGRIVSIAPHKFGPIHAILHLAEHVDREKPTIVNYCDFTCYWDWQHFKAWVNHSACAGAVPAYRGFHPHTLGTTNYAYIREQNNWMLDIQEKKPYTDNRMNEYASSGTYYFASGQLMLDAFQETVKQNLHVGGEYYVSLAYKTLLAKHLPVAVYDLQHFMQWGTPEDVAEYQRWSRLFHQLSHPATKPLPRVGSVVVPMAGLGQRFLQEGYQVTKPLIPVSGQPMVIQAVKDLPPAQQYVFVLRRDMPDYQAISDNLLRAYPQARLEVIPEVTEGQACTALLGVNALQEIAEPMVIGACDNGAIYDAEKLQVLLADEDTDVIVWGVRGHTNAIRHPHMYGWIDSDGGVIQRISVKVPLAVPETDAIVLGTFIFKRASDFRACVASMMARDARVNGEFYLDTCINDAIQLGLNCKLFEVEHYISWGTPNDLRTFEYWQSCFHKWTSHPYRLERDARVPSKEREALETRYHMAIPLSLG